MMQSNQFKIRHFWKEGIVLLAFGTIFCLISLVNHYNFRTGALDLGMFNHALYSYAHLKNNTFTLDLQPVYSNYLAAHFSPLTMLYAPFYYLFGSYTLLVIQIIAILAGSIGCYRVAKLKLPDVKWHFLILILFLGQWAIVSALSFDFHENVVAAMVLPWLYYYYLKANKKAVLVFFLLMLAAKENMALWLVFIFSGFMLEKGFRYFFNHFRAYLRFEIPLMLFALVYFIVVLGYVMPAMNHAHASQLSRYAQFGNSVPEILINLLAHPVQTFSLFFESPGAEPFFADIKAELHKTILLSGGIALLLRPAWLLVLLPIYAQKLLTEDYVLWGINNQYSIEFTPVITLAFIDLLTKVNRVKFLALSLLIISAFFALKTNYDTLKERKSVWYNPVNSDPFLKDHYSANGLNRKFLYQELAKIPAEIPLSVCSNLAPHLTDRDRIYHYPFIHDAKMIVLLTHGRSFYPFTEQKEFDKSVQSLLNSGKFVVHLHEKGLLILRRK